MAFLMPFLQLSVCFSIFASASVMSYMRSFIFDISLSSAQPNSSSKIDFSDFKSSICSDRVFIFPISSLRLKSCNLGILSSSAFSFLRSLTFSFISAYNSKCLSDLLFNALTSAFLANFQKFVASML